MAARYVVYATGERVSDRYDLFVLNYSMGSAVKAFTDDPLHPAIVAVHSKLKAPIAELRAACLEVHRLTREHIIGGINEAYDPVQTELAALGHQAAAPAEQDPWGRGKSG